MADRVRGLPGALAVTYSKVAVLADRGWSSRVRPVGVPPRAGGPDSVMVNAVGTGFFGTFGIPILRGGSLDPRDEARPAAVAVVNQALARAYFGGADPLGAGDARVGARRAGSADHEQQPREDGGAEREREPPLEVSPHRLLVS